MVAKFKHDRLAEPRHTARIDLHRHSPKPNVGRLAGKPGADFGVIRQQPAIEPYPSGVAGLLGKNVRGL